MREYGVDDALADLVGIANGDLDRRALLYACSNIFQLLRTMSVRYWELGGQWGRVSRRRPGRYRWEDA